jgi:hypothetical protein
MEILYNWLILKICTHHARERAFEGIWSITFYPDYWLEEEVLLLKKCSFEMLQNS